MKRITEYRPYAEQLQQPEWKALRLRIFERDGNKCTDCGSNENLHCHHTLYVHGFSAWEYADNCYLTLCKYCHKELHETTKIPVFTTGYKKVRKYLREDIRKRLDKDVAKEKLKLKKINNYKYYYQKEIKTLIDKRTLLLQSDIEHPDLPTNMANIDKSINEYLKFLKDNGR